MNVPVCETCNDTHVMTLGEREVPCTFCPVPCEACRAPREGYCASRPCTCPCHARAKGERAALPSATRIEIDVSTENDGSSFPWWMIVRPPLRRSVEAAALAITGPFFSRAEATKELESRRHHYGDKAIGARAVVRTSVTAARSAFESSIGMGARIRRIDVSAPLRWRRNDDRIVIEHVVDPGEPDADRWAIRSDRSFKCYGRNGWEGEPRPDERDAAFLARCRWTLDEALRAVEAMRDEEPAVGGGS